MASNLVTLVNQTGKPMVLNLAPVSDESIHLPPRGRVHVDATWVQAVEVQGALQAKPPRLCIVEAPVVSSSDAKPVAAESKPADDTSANDATTSNSKKKG